LGGGVAFSQRRPATGSPGRCGRADARPRPETRLTRPPADLAL